MFWNNVTASLCVMISMETGSSDQLEKGKNNMRYTNKTYAIENRYKFASLCFCLRYCISTLGKDGHILRGPQSGYTLVSRDQRCF